MTVRETIAALRARNLEVRLQKLQEIDAPSIVIEKTAEGLEESKRGLVKVNGLERKYKIANEEVLELYQENTTGMYYGQGKKNTVLLKMVTEAGTFYYDYFANKIGKDQIELDAKIVSSQFERVS